MSDVNALEVPMGNAELRLRLQNIEETGKETHGLATYTNGTVRWQTKMIYLAMGALFILAPTAGWLCISVIHDQAQIAALKVATSPSVITTAVKAGIDQATMK